MLELALVHGAIKVNSFILHFDMASYSEVCDRLANVQLSDGVDQGGRWDQGPVENEVS